MSACCRTCDHRNSAIHAFPSAPSQLDVCLITLTFKARISARTPSYVALNTVLNNIVDSEESSSHPTTFTSWSPCLANPDIAVILSTARETCSSAAYPIFDGLLQYLAKPLCVKHIYLDYSVLSLAAPSSDHRIAVDIIQLQAPNPGVAAAIGKQFGWDPKRSSLSLQMSSRGSAAFSRPGDLVKDFWAWAELSEDDVMSSSTRGSSFASSQESLPAPSILRNWNSDEKNMALPFPDEDDVEDQKALDDETLIMIFQWSSHADAERFKHPLQSSFGLNGEEVRDNLWDLQVAHPVRQLQGIGAKTETCKLELRAVEPRLSTATRAEGNTAGRVRSGSKRLSVLVSGFGERVSGLWK
jgi:hypothetical protein